MGRLRQRPDLLRRTTYDRVLLLLPGSEDVIELRGPAADCWECMVEARTVSEAAADLARTYGADARTVQADLEPFVRDLVARELLVPDG